MLTTFQTHGPFSVAKAGTGPAKTLAHWKTRQGRKAPVVGRDIAEWEQLLIRALTFRMTTLHLLDA